MLEAEAKGYLVSDVMKRNVLSNLHRLASTWKPIRSNYASSEEETQAYRLFVLALAQSPDMGAMNRMKETTSLLPMSRWMLASAYALVGRQDVASGLIRQVTNMTSVYGEYDETFGSNVRDKAIRLMTLCLLNRGNEAASMANDISRSLSSNEWLSTQSTSFALVAFSKYMPYSFAKYKEMPNKSSIYRRIGKRIILLWIFGIMCQGNLLGLDPQKIYLFSNTLQAIAVGYLFTALLYLNVRRSVQIGVAVALLLIYWAAMQFISFDGFGGGNYTADGNLAEGIDRYVLGRFRDHSTVVDGVIDYGTTYRYTCFL